jgi:glycosyltransferase involved in cell wall biosynthesis
MPHKETKKRLLYIAVADPTIFTTGSTVRMNYFLRYLTERYDVDVVCLEGSGHAPGACHYDTELEKNCAHFHRVRFKLHRYFLFSAEIYAHAVVRAKQYRYDYIFADYGLAAVYGIMLARKFKIPFIYSSHNLEFRQHAIKITEDIRRIFLVPYVFCVELLACIRADLVITISEIDNAFYKKWFYLRRSLVIPQGFDDNVFHPFYETNRGQNKKKVLYVGNYAIAINREAVEIIKKSIIDEVLKAEPDVIFQFVGANPPVNISHPAIEYCGYVENVVDYIRAADIVISPVRRAGGMPTKVVEALACGKHVVTTPAASRGISDKYLNLHRTNIEDFARVIVGLLHGPREIYTRQFEQFKDEYSWQNNLKLLDRELSFCMTGENKAIAVPVPVDVVVLNYNGASKISETLRSLLCQTHSINKIIVVDDASTDESVELLTRDFPECELVRFENNINNVNRARNAGIRKCTTRYVLLTDNDVVFTENCLETMLHYMLQFEDAAVVTPRLLFKDDHNKVYSDWVYYHYTGNAISPNRNRLLNEAI